MKLHIMLLCVLILAPSVFSNSWTDPDWEKMVRNAKLIGLFEVIEGGEHKALVQPISLIKGTRSEKLELANLNNAHWSEDFMVERALRKGQKIYLFVHAWNDIYTDPTPTTGMMPLNPDDTVNYSLFSPSGSWDQPAHPADEFEFFISNIVHFQATGYPDAKLIQKLGREIDANLTNIETNGLSDRLIRYRLWGGRNWLEGLKWTPNQPQPEVRYQAALLLGEMLPNDNAEALLLKLLDDPDSMVQGQAVEALMKTGNTNETLALLTRKLGSSAPGSSGPTNIMNPIMNTYLGGQLAIIREIKTHKYAAATNELVAVARSTQNPMVFEKAYRTLKKFDSPELSGLTAQGLRSENPRLVHEAILFSRDLPKPVEKEVREALEHLVMTTDLDAHERSLIFKSLTHESLPALQPKLGEILKQESPKWWAEDYLRQAIDLTEANSAPEHHEMVDRILYYWIGIDSRALSHPGILKRKIELENHYERRILDTSVIDTQKYQPKASAFVAIDFSQAAATPHQETPPHAYRVLLEMTVPADDPDNPFEAIHASYEDRSKTSPLLIWRRAIATEADLPLSNVGIFCHPSSGRGGSISGADERIESKSGIIRAYVDYAKRTQNENAIALVELMLDSFLASHMGCVKICSEIWK